MVDPSSNRTRSTSGVVKRPFEIQMFNQALEIDEASSCRTGGKYKLGHASRLGKPPKVRPPFGLSVLRSRGTISPLLASRAEARHSKRSAITAPPLAIDANRFAHLNPPRTAPCHRPLPSIRCHLSTSSCAASPTCVSGSQEGASSRAAQSEIGDSMRSCGQRNAGCGRLFVDGSGFGLLIDRSRGRFEDRTQGSSGDPHPGRARGSIRWSR